MSVNWLGLNSGKTGSVYMKHLLALRDYATPRKLYNIALCEIEKRLRVVHPRSMPYTASIDVTNACNLRCPGCPTGVGIVGRKKSMLDLSHLEKFLDEAAPYLVIAYLYNWGETLLHPQAPEIVRMVHERRIFTSISSNLNIRDFDQIAGVCDAGLDHLIISADGATRESYQKYRVGGDFDLVIENIRRIAAYRKERNTTRPILEWQILTFNYLESELESALAQARAAGVDWFNPKAPTAPARLQLKADHPEEDKHRTGSTCGLLWHSIVLQADGGIAPCCYTYHKRDDFGHIDQAPVAATRHNERYTLARTLFDPARLATLDPKLDHPCLRCPLVHEQPHLQNYLAANPNAFVQSDFMGILHDPAESSATWQGL